MGGDPSRIRTCNPRSRNPLLYPVELWDRGIPYYHYRPQFKNASDDCMSSQVADPDVLKRAFLAACQVVGIYCVELLAVQAGKAKDGRLLFLTFNLVQALARPAKPFL